MDGSKHPARTPLAWLVAAVVFVAASGANCQRVVQQYMTTPRVLPPNASLEQIVEVVNGNSRQIQSFQADDATIQFPNSPRLRASVAMQRPGRLRLRADTALTGAEVDLGSNVELFWFWTRRDPHKAVYYCRHDQFDQSQARRALPITPAELIEAFGLVDFDPALPHQGPVTRPDGLLEVRTIRETPQGPTTRVVVIDPVRGWVVQQHLFDAQNQLVASVAASQHRRDPLTGLVMPKAIDVNCPAAQFSLRVNLGNVAINTIGSDRDALWAMPAFQDVQWVDLANPGPQYLPASTVSPPPLPSRPPQRAAPAMPW
ncbi:MAG: hypothetical protein JW809_15975 [Pirellulales bacterium]|nr:hypothetical protein [Pirellulales bacterium]